jgi:hypothetical protein
MRIKATVIALTAVLFFVGPPGASVAEVILTTDKPDYTIGEVVHITAHNAGPEDETLLSFPFFAIWNEDTSQCVMGCVGLPDINPFPAGESITMDWDTGQVPDAPGRHIVGVAINDGPTASYVLTGSVPSDHESWTTLKGRYR